MSNRDSIECNLMSDFIVVAEMRDLQKLVLWLTQCHLSLASEDFTEVESSLANSFEAVRLRSQAIVYLRTIVSKF